MTAVAAGLAVLSLALFLWSYAIYPPLIAALAARRMETGASLPADQPPSIEVIVSAADEEEVIAGRVADLLAQQGVDRISIGCDGSVDATATRARAAAAGSPTVHVVEFPTRRGKAAVINDLVRGSSAEVLVFTDANTRFDPEAVTRLVRPFGDASVGAVCGRLLVETPAQARETPESRFWDRETRLKEAEGRLGVCVGANGAIYAIRRELATPLPEDTTSMDDFVIPVRVARRGKQILFAGSAVAREEAARDVFAEVSRRFRIGIGAGQVLRRETWLLRFWSHPTLTLAFLARKAARWVAPLAALLSAVAALFAPPLAAAGVAALVSAAFLLAAARLRPRLGGLAGRLYYFAVLNVALALGVAAGLAGYSRPAWARTARSGTAGG